MILILIFISVSIYLYIFINIYLLLAFPPPKVSTAKRLANTLILLRELRESAKVAMERVHQLSEEQAEERRREESSDGAERERAEGVRTFELECAQRDARQFLVRIVISTE